MRPIATCFSSKRHTDMPTRRTTSAAVAPLPGCAGHNPRPTSLSPPPHYFCARTIRRFHQSTVWLRAKHRAVLGKTSCGFKQNATLFHPKQYVNLVTRRASCSDKTRVLQIKQHGVWGKTIRSLTQNKATFDPKQSGVWLKAKRCFEPYYMGLNEE